MHEPASLTIRSTLALPVKWGTWNLPPLIASTSGSVDQTTCFTPASLAARTAAVACLRSSVPCSQKLVTRKTPCAPSNAASRVSGCPDPLDDFVGEFAMLAWIAAQSAHPELAARPAAHGLPRLPAARLRRSRRSVSCCLLSCSWHYPTRVGLVRVSWRSAVVPSFRASRSAWCVRSSTSHGRHGPWRPCAWRTPS